VGEEDPRCVVVNGTAVQQLPGLAVSVDRPVADDPRVKEVQTLLTRPRDCPVRVGDEHCLALMNGNLGRPNLNLKCHYVLLNGSLFAFAGFVSGISSQARKTVLSATTAMLRNPIALPKFPTIKPKNVVLTVAPMPASIPTKPCAKLNLPVPVVRSATIKAVTTPKTLPCARSKTEPLHIVARHRHLHHLDCAAGKPELHPHQRTGARPGDKVVGGGNKEALVGEFGIDSREKRVVATCGLLSRSDQRGFAQSHSSFPLTECPNLSAV